MYKVLIASIVAVLCIAPASALRAGDLMYGCWSRPACGKVCKLVCDTTTLVSVCYGCECDTICVPGPSKQGCKHCVTTCCGCGGDTCADCCNGSRQTHPPKCEFCWRDWFACGCARPRSVKVLTKYQAEKEICSYYWEVIDACDCSCAAAGGQHGISGCQCVYKSAPSEGQVGDRLALSADEQAALVHWLPADDQNATVALAAAVNVDPATAGDVPHVASNDLADDHEKSGSSLWHRMANALRLSTK